jgi:DNA-binding LytR/AlgR family response regulator
MKIVICDQDEEQSREGKALILECAERHGIEAKVDIARSGEQLLFFKDTKYADVDLIYMVYNLPKMNGMETAVELRRRGYIGDIVFYTDDPAHACEGYTVDALAYLIKGKESDETHEKVFCKAYRNFRKRQREIMTLSYHGEQIHILIEDIIYFEVLNHTVTVHYYKDGKAKTFECYSGLTKIENQLTGKGFLRVHKSYLVSEKHIYKKMPEQIEMSNGDIIPVGKNVKI